MANKASKALAGLSAIIATLPALAQQGIALPESIDLSDPMWKGTDVLRGNPHGLTPQDLFRPPVPCTAVEDRGPLERGTYEVDLAWPNGIVPIRFSSNVTASQQSAFLEAMAEIANRTEIIFTVWSNEPAHILVQNDTGNFSSSIGRTGAEQKIGITSWNSKYIICHEIMHAIGYYHEQARSDRDNFVVINTGNISQTACQDGDGNPASCNSQFAIRPNAEKSAVYDYESIMHYGRDDFSTNGQDTITTKDPSKQDVIGNRSYISDGDQLSLSTLYGLPQLGSAFWVFTGFLIPSFSTGQFGTPDISVLNAIDRVASGQSSITRINITNTHTQTISSPLVIQKNIRINGAPLTIQ